MSLTARIVAILLVCAALIAGWWRLTAHYEAKGYTRAQAEAKAAADAQTTRNRELQRAAEIRYTVTAQARERFIVQTVKEVHHAAESLATCPVPRDAVRLLNDAAACARGDSAGACGVGDRLSGP